MKSLLPLFLCVLTMAALQACKVQRLSDNQHICSIDSIVGDTLFIEFPDSENEFCEIDIRRHDVHFWGREQVVDGSVFFDVHRLPAGYHVAWLRVNNLFIRKTFYKK